MAKTVIPVENSGWIQQKLTEEFPCVVRMESHHPYGWTHITVMHVLDKHEDIRTAFQNLNGLVSMNTWYWYRLDFFFQDANDALMFKLMVDTRAKDANNE